MWKCSQLLILVVLPISFFMSACERDTTAQIDGQNPPTISLSGSGKIHFLRVMREPVEANFYEKGEGGIWQIEPEGEARELTISHYPPIKYGEVPSGFIQRIPKDGGAPPRLEEGQTYNVWAPTYDANGGGVRFAVRNGKSVELP